jgi:2,3-dihydroxy-p-cumate/2,3-dihydroxybenzoate 3,4-dioxygenase
MIDLQRVSYVRFGTRDIEGAIRFATDVLGLEIAEVSKGAVYFKSDEREHTLCYFEGGPHDQAVAFEVGSRAALSWSSSPRKKLMITVARLICQ